MLLLLAELRQPERVDQASIRAAQQSAAQQEPARLTIQLKALAGCYYMYRSGDLGMMGVPTGFSWSQVFGTKVAYPPGLI